MAEPRYPTMDEFWHRLDERRVEPDLRRELHRRLDRDRQPMRRLRPEPLTSIMARLLPGTLPPRALAAFVDEHVDHQLGRADDRAGLLPRAELIPLGLHLLDEQAVERHGRAFAELSGIDQDGVLAAAERGELPAPRRFDWSTWFRRLRSLALLGLGSDPRGMVLMGFPGPSYQPGHVWLDEGAIATRVSRRRGYWQL